MFLNPGRPQKVESSASAETSVLTPAEEQRKHQYLRNRCAIFFLPGQIPPGITSPIWLRMFTPWGGSQGNRQTGEHGFWLLEKNA